MAINFFIFIKKNEGAYSSGMERGAGYLNCSSLLFKNENKDDLNHWNHWNI